MSDHSASQSPDDNKGLPIQEPFIFVRLSWPPPGEQVTALDTPDKEYNALKDNIVNNGFGIHDVPEIVPLGEHQYDIAVCQRVLREFNLKYEPMAIIPFGAHDHLKNRHGDIVAAKIAYGKYASTLEQGVIPGTEEWFEDQMSRYHQIEEACRKYKSRD